MNFKKLLSLAAATAIAAGSFAAMAVTASAEGEAYAEWILNSNEAVYKNNSLTVAVTADESLTTQPTLTSNNIKDKTITAQNYTDIKGRAQTSGTHALSLSASGTCLTVDSKLSSYTSLYGSYDLTISYYKQGQNKESGLTLSDASSTWNEPETDHNKSGIVTSITATGVKTDTISVIRNTKEMTILYMGIKYNPKSGSGDESETIDVTGVTIDGDSSVVVDKTITLTATVAPSNATNKKVTWSSDKPDVASVNPNTGVVTGKAIGTANITVTTEDGSFTATKEITVTSAPVLETMKIDDEITFTEEKTFSEETIYAKKLKIFAVSNYAVTIDSSSKTVNGKTYDYRIKSGGTSGESNEVKYRQYAIDAATKGTLQIIAATSSSNSTRKIKVGKNALAVKDLRVYEFPVEAGENLITFPSGGINIYSFKLVKEKNTRKFAFDKLLSEISDNGLIVTVTGTDSGEDFTASSTIFKDNHFEGTGEVQIGIILNVPDNMTVTDVTLE